MNSEDNRCKGRYRSGYHVVWRKISRTLPKTAPLSKIGSWFFSILWSQCAMGLSPRDAAWVSASSSAAVEWNLSDWCDIGVLTSGRQEDAICPCVTESLTTTDEAFEITLHRLLCPRYRSGLLQAKALHLEVFPVYAWKNLEHKMGIQLQDRTVPGYCMFGSDNQ
jgi:hypothetical protein